MEWPVLRSYDARHLRRLAMPVGGIGTGTVSLGGRGNLRDWEVMNRPGKGFIPSGSGPGTTPFLAVHVARQGKQWTRLLEGPLEEEEYEGESGSRAPSHGLPRFRDVSFSAAYPFGTVHLSDPQIPVTCDLQVFNPLVPGDLDASSLPAAFLRVLVTNRTDEELMVSVCFSLPNFIGMDGTRRRSNWLEGLEVYGAQKNRNQWLEADGLRGFLMTSEGVPPLNEAWGTLALVTPASGQVAHRSSWNLPGASWGGGLLSFWDEFSASGEFSDLEGTGEDVPMASLALKHTIPAGSVMEFPFILAWHFPNRPSWTREQPCVDGCCAEGDMLHNHYTSRFPDAWEAAAHSARHWKSLEDRTLRFVQAFLASSLPEEVKEAALFNLSTLRSQTVFRSADGRFYGWEGCGDHQGCCYGTCTHVWNYEHATPFLFGEMARQMREVEFGPALQSDGLMNFRVSLPLGREPAQPRAAADGQMGTIVKAWREWQMGGDQSWLERLWPQIHEALRFCWQPGGWDADGDGVMEGCQHNTMDVEYYGPNPQMQGWYLAALRAAEEMARAVGDEPFRQRCGDLFTHGSRWMDEHLFNGEYYIQRVQPPGPGEKVHPALQAGMGSKDLTNPTFQLGNGCLVDQLVGQTLAHLYGLGNLHDAGKVRQTCQAILKYNWKDSFHDHFSCMRSYVLGDEAGLLMAAYPKDRPEMPFPYFTEVMTGFEYTAALEMVFSGMEEEAIRCVRAVRARYDGARRSPFDEAECGHHYARAMASWGFVPALSGFRYSAVERSMRFAARGGNWFWANGSAWGTCQVSHEPAGWEVSLEVWEGDLDLKSIQLGNREIAEPVSLSTSGPERAHHLFWFAEEVRQ